MRHETIPNKPGHVVTAAVWKLDRARSLMRLMQVAYEPRKRPEVEVEPPSVKRRQGLLL